MRRARACCLLLLVSLPVWAAPDPDMDFFIFIAEFTDEQGDWNGPDIDQPPDVEQSDGADNE